ncbi:unnamed protein product [Cyclocybe aegerita]|uniref:Uncharacterized protein n=1 Tax=Cyclocybe aegerita TaxID=1973307 RepID=A0A8S0XWV0_CYCAE|nr:unnamed protein product [Cyclocybe aegerita]
MPHPRLQTCKTTNEATMQRSVWLFAVQTMMKENAIPKCAFSLKWMDNSALECIALSPRLFYNCIVRTRTDLAEPRSVQLLLDHMSKTAWNHEHQRTPGYTAVFLVPGGRYLVTSGRVTSEHETLRTVIDLWDLGLPGNRGRNKLLASSVIGDADLQPRLVVPTPDGNGLRLISATADRIYVHELLPDPFHAECMLPACSSGPPGDSILSLSFSNNRLAYLLRSWTIIISDIEDGSFCTLKTPLGREPMTSTTSLKLFGDSIVLAYQGKIFHWNVHHLQRHRCSDVRNGVHIRSMRPDAIYSNLLHNNLKRVGSFINDGFDDTGLTFLPHSAWSSFQWRPSSQLSWNHLWRQVRILQASIPWRLQGKNSGCTERFPRPPADVRWIGRAPRGRRAP